MSGQVEVKGPEDIVLPEDPAVIKKTIFELRRLCQKYKADADRNKSDNEYLRKHVRKLNNIVTDLQGRRIGPSL